MKLSRLFRSPVAVLAAVVIVSGSVFAFAAAITRPENALPISAGQFKATSLGYVINDVNFIADDTEASNITVSFTLTHGLNPDVIGTNGDNTSVKVKFNSEDATYTGCNFNGISNLWECAPASYPIANVTELNVVAISNE